MHKDAIVIPLFTFLAKLFHRPLDVSWGPTQMASGGRSGTLRDTWRVVVRFVISRDTQHWKCISIWKVKSIGKYVCFLFGSDIPFYIYEENALNCNTGSIQKGWLKKTIWTSTNQNNEHESLIMVMLMEESYYIVFGGT